MRAHGLLETFSELAVREPDLMRLPLQASVAALVNMHSAEAESDEIERQAVEANRWTCQMTSKAAQVEGKRSLFVGSAEAYTELSMVPGLQCDYDARQARWIRRVARETSA